MSMFNSKRNINEKKVKSKKTISLIGKTITADWKILIILFILLLLIALIFSWNLYTSAVSQSFLSEDATTQAGSLRVNTQQLDRVVNELNSKKEKFNELTGGKIIDDNIGEVSTTTAETE